MGFDGIKQNLELKFLITCIVFDIVDTLLDVSGQGLELLGIGSGVIEAGFDFLDGLLIVLGFVTFMILGARINEDTLMFIGAGIDPIIDEGLPIPFYTGSYLLMLYMSEGSER